MANDDEKCEWIQELKFIPKYERDKCPICQGEKFKKQRVLFSQNYQIKINISIINGRMHVQMWNENELMEESEFPIKYCPICGRKIKPFKKDGKKRKK